MRHRKLILFTIREAILIPLGVAIGALAGLFGYFAFLQTSGLDVKKGCPHNSGFDCMFYPWYIQYFEIVGLVLGILISHAAFFALRKVYRKMLS